MKANFDRETWKAELDNEAIKAIRFVNGFTTDLRIKLTMINKSVLFDWIQDNEIGILGIVPRPDATSDDWNKYEKMIWSVVNQVIG